MPGTSELFGTLDGGRILDVGTGKGTFIQSLLEELGSYTEIIGLDISDAGAAGFADAFGANPAVHFVQADATAMPFGDDSFDTVAIAGSLHHVGEPERVLAEMHRVLRPGGTFIVGEQMRDRLTKPETTHLLFHEWSEELLGVALRRTYRHGEIIDLVAPLDLEGVQEIVERDERDPMDATRIERWDRMTADYVDRASESAALSARGQAIRARVREVGIAIGPALFVIGRKPRRVSS